MYSIDLPPLIVSRSKRFTFMTTVFAMGLNVLPAQAHVNSDYSRLHVGAQIAGSKHCDFFKFPHRQTVNIAAVFRGRKVPLTGFGLNQNNGIDRIVSKFSTFNFAVVRNSSIDPTSKTKQLLAWGEHPT